MNSYEMLQLVRDMIGEATASHWTDTNILKRMNFAQRKVAMLVANNPGQWLITSQDVTPVSSVITLPADCARPVYLEEKSTGYPINWMNSVEMRRVSRSIGTTLDQGFSEIYPLMSTIEVNKDSYSTECTLWYEIRVPDMLTGAAGASTGADALHMTGGAFIDDYYNNCLVEVYSSSLVDIRSLISDYVASTRVATISGTATSADIFGTISRLPEEAHYLIVLEAVYSSLVKPGSVLDEKVVFHYKDEIKLAKQELVQYLNSRTPTINRGVAIGDPWL